MEVLRGSGGQGRPQQWLNGLVVGEVRRDFGQLHGGASLIRLEFLPSSSDRAVRQLRFAQLK